MKQIVITLLFAFVIHVSFAQENDYYPDKQSDNDKKVAINLGVMMGGGSLLGVDFEVMPVNRFGIQAGVGLSSFGFGLNYHFKNRINSPFLSFVYWQQGLKENHYASYVGPMYNFRLKKVLQFGIGYGIVVDKGPAIQGTKFEDVTSALLYNIGIFFPL